MPDHQRITQLPNFLYARELRTSGIYSITCTANGLIYIGSAVSLSLRWRAHYRQLLCGKHHNAIMRNSWAKYGPEEFTFAVMEYCPVDALIEREQFHLDACPKELCANLSPTAGSLLGFKQSSEVCELMRQQRKGIAKHTEETIARLSAMKKGIASRPGGWSMTDEQKQKLREIRTGTIYGEETRARVAAASTGRRHTSEARAKISRNSASYPPELVAEIRNEYLNTSKSINAIARERNMLNWTLCRMIRAVPPYDYNEPIQLVRKPATEEHRARISAAGKGVPKPAGFGEKLRGNKNSVGRKHTAEHIAKAHAHLIGNQYTAGRTLSEEHRMKLSAATKGKPKPPGFAERMRGNKNASKQLNLSTESADS